MLTNQVRVDLKSIVNRYLLPSLNSYFNEGITFMSTSHKAPIEVKDIESNVYYKNNPEFFLQLKDMVVQYPKHYSRILKYTRTDILEWINSQLPLLQDDVYKTSTKTYWILFNLTAFPICNECKKDDNYRMKNVSVFDGYSILCSKTCHNRNKDVIAQKKRTKKIRYGDENYTNREKAKQTCLKHFGVENPSQSSIVQETIRQNSLKKYNCEHPSQSIQAKKKHKQTCIERFGVENPFSSDDIQLKSRQTKLDKYGDEFYSNYEQTIQTCIEKFGVSCVFQNEQIKQKSIQTILDHYGVKNVFASPEIQAKSTQTKIERYGNENYVNVEQRKKTNLERYGYECAMKNSSVRKKTQHKYNYNGIFFDSAPELALYIYLVDNDIEFEYQPNTSFQYEINNEQKSYFPDFKIENRYVEIKGDQFLKEDGTWQNPYDHTQDTIYEAKHRCAIQNGVEILYSADYQKYIDYISHTYGKNYLLQFQNNSKNV